MPLRGATHPGNSNLLAMAEPRTQLYGSQPLSRNSDKFKDEGKRLYIEGSYKMTL